MAGARTAGRLEAYRGFTTPTAATLLLTSRHRDCACFSSQVPIEAGMEAGIEYVGCRRRGWGKLAPPS